MLALRNTRTRMVGHFLDKCDLVFGIGTSFQKTLVSTTVPKGKVMVQSTNDAKDINGEYPIDIAIIGDAKLVLRQVIDEVKAQAGANGPSNANGTAAEIKSVKEEWLKQWGERLTSDQVPLNPYRVIWDLLQTVDVGNTIATHDSGNPRDQMVPFWQTTNPRTYIGWGNSTQLGTGLGLALGAQLAAPQKQAINVMGDTAVGMAGIDFETAVRERIPLITVILNNSAMGGLREEHSLGSRALPHQVPNRRLHEHDPVPRLLQPARRTPRRNHPRHPPRPRIHRRRPPRSPRIHHPRGPGVLELASQCPANMMKVNEEFQPWARSRSRSQLAH